MIRTHYLRENARNNLVGDGQEASPSIFFSSLLELVSDALLKVYWYKKSLRNTLRRSGVSENFLSTWAEDESKREMLERLFPKLETSERGILAVNRLADTLLEQENFPDLERLEDSRLRIKQAEDAIKALRDYRQRQAENAQSERDRTQAQQRARELQQEVLKRHHQLNTLADRLNSLSTELGKQTAGYAFQDWFYDLLDYFEVVNRRPYNVQGRQIDGTLRDSAQDLCANTPSLPLSDDLVRFTSCATAGAWGASLVALLEAEERRIRDATKLSASRPSSMDLHMRNILAKDEQADLDRTGSGDSELMAASHRSS